MISLKDKKIAAKKLKDIQIKLNEEARERAKEIYRKELYNGFEKVERKSFEVNNKDITELSNTSF